MGSFFWTNLSAKKLPLNDIDKFTMVHLLQGSSEDDLGAAVESRHTDRIRL